MTLDPDDDRMPLSEVEDLIAETHDYMLEAWDNGQWLAWMALSAALAGFRLGYWLRRREKQRR